MVVAAIGVALGIALIPLFYAATAFLAAAGPLGVWAVGGLYTIPGLMSLYVTRRPGAAVLNGLFVGLVQLPFTPVGFVVLIQTLVRGLACELPFLATRYRRFGLPALMVGGALAQLLTLALAWVPYGIPALSPVLQAVIVAVTAISGAVLGGLPAKALSDALAKSGVLSGYGIGRTSRKA
jgi:energy-coupling factor transport system substrate-specific component